MIRYCITVSILLFCLLIGSNHQFSLKNMHEDAILFVEKKSYINAIDKYEDIYDLETLILGENHSDVAGTLLQLGTLYYKVGDFENALRCLYEHIRIIEFNSVIQDRSLILPLEYIYSIYKQKDQTDLSVPINLKLESLYALDTIKYQDMLWHHFLFDGQFSNNSLFAMSNSDLLDTITIEDPRAYFDQAHVLIDSNNFEEAANLFETGFIAGLDIFEYKFFNKLFTNYDDIELTKLKDFFQTKKYSDKVDIQVSAFFYISLISFKLNNFTAAIENIGQYLSLNPDDIWGYLLTADIHYKNMEYIKALDYYQRVLWMNKEDKDVIFKQGLCLYNLSYFRDAKISFNQVLSLDQEHFESKFYLAEILVNEQLYDDATPILESLLLMDTNDDLIYVLLGTCYYNTNNYKGALGAYRRSIEINPNNPYVYYNLGEIYEKLIKTNQAIENYSMSYQLQENNHLLTYKLGLLLYENGQYKKALSYLREYLSFDNENIEVYEILGKVLLNLDRHPEAIDIYNKLLEFDSSNISYYKIIGQLYWDLNKLSKAKEYFKKVLELNEESGEILYFLGHIENLDNNFVSARDYFLTAIDCGYSHSEIYSQLAFTYINLLDYSSIISLLNEAMYYHPDNMDYIYYLGIAYHKNGMHSHSIDYLKQYQSSNRNDLMVSYLIGISYHHLGEYSKSVKYLKLADKNGKNADILYYIGLSYAQLGDHKEAIKNYKKSVYLDSKEADTIYALGKSYIEINNKKDASRQLKYLLQLNIELFESLQIAFDEKFGNL